MADQDVTLAAPITVTSRETSSGKVLWLIEDAEGRQMSCWRAEIADHLAQATAPVGVTVAVKQGDGGRTYRNIVAVPGVIERQSGGGGGNRDLLEQIVAELRAIRAAVSGSVAAAGRHEGGSTRPTPTDVPEGEGTSPPSIPSPLSPPSPSADAADACPSCGAPWGPMRTSSGKRLCEQGHVERGAR